MVLLSAAHRCALGLFPQVQDRCDYDLVTPLALLFYSAVLYVSAEAAAPIPARGRHQTRVPLPGTSQPVFISSSQKERFCRNPEGSGSNNPCTSLETKKMNFTGFEAINFFKARLVRKGDRQ